MSKKQIKAPAMDIGINATDREKIARGLSVLLADSYTLYLMTHNFHWNVTGPQFNSLHLMFGPIHGAMERAGCDRRAHPRLGLPGTGDLQGVRQAGHDQGGRWGAQGE